LSEIDYKTIDRDSNNLVDAIDKLIDKIDAIDKSKLSEIEMNELTTIYYNLKELYSINQEEKIFEVPLNDEIVNNLYNSIGSKLGLIENKEYVELKPENSILKIPDLEHFESDEKTITDVIIDKNIPLENKKYIIKTLENNINANIENSIDSGTIFKAGQLCRNPNSRANKRSLDCEPNTSNLIDITFDEIALLILSAGNMDGSMSKAMDENGDLVPIIINVMDNGEERQLSIKDIIPSSRNLEGEKFEAKFNTIFTLAQIGYLEHFRNLIDEEGNIDISGY